MSDATVSHLPRAPLAGAIALACLTVLTVGAARLTGFTATTVEQNAPSVKSVMLRFEDAADGSVAVRDAKTGVQIATAAPGTNGFLRGALRGLMRARRLDGGMAAEPFLLEQKANGQLLLQDTSDGVTIDLNAYGQTNAAVFRAFLKAAPGGDNS